MRHYVELRFKGRPHEITAERNSFFACCRVVDIILQMKTGIVDCKSASGRRELSDAIFEHLRLHIAAYGTGNITPKHHLNHGLPKQYSEKGVFDAFVAERLHLRVSEVAELCKNLPHFERSVLGRVMQRQILALRNDDLRSGLRGKLVRSHDGLSLASSMQCASLKIATGDIVSFARQAGIVVACAAEDSCKLFVIVRVCEWRSAETAHSELWRTTQHLAVWPANAVASPHAWYYRGEEFVLIW